MNPIQLIDWLKKEWATISNAPISFISALLVVSTISYSISSLFLSSKSDSQSEIIKLLEHKLKDINDRISNESEESQKLIINLKKVIMEKDIEIGQIKTSASLMQDQMSQKLSSANADLIRLGPWHLDESQRASISRRVSGLNGVIDIYVDGSDKDVKTLGGDFTSVFRSSGWTAYMPIISSPKNPPKYGFALTVSSKNSLNSLEFAVKNALEEIGIPLEIRETNELSRNVSLLLTSRSSLFSWRCQ